MMYVYKTGYQDSHKLQIFIISYSNTVHNILFRMLHINTEYFDALSTEWTTYFGDVKCTAAVNLTRDVYTF